MGSPPPTRYHLVGQLTTWEPARDLGGLENLIDIFDKAELEGTNKSDVVADFSVNNDDMGMWNISNAIFVKTEALRTHKN